MSSQLFPTYILHISLRTLVMTFPPIQRINRTKKHTSVNVDSAFGSKSAPTRVSAEQVRIIESYDTIVCTEISQESNMSLFSCLNNYSRSAVTIHHLNYRKQPNLKLSDNPPQPIHVMKK